MKKKVLILVLLLVIGFASVSTTLVLNGSIGIKLKSEDFNVIFLSATVSGNDEVKATISEDKKSITFETNKLSAVGDKANLVYKVKNNSTQYDANVKVNCTGINEEYLSFEGDFAGKTLPQTNFELMRAQEVRMGTLNTELIKVYGGEETKVPITCTLEIEGEERDSIVEESACTYSDGTEWTFDYTGSEQEFVAPCSGEYKIELWGASGGNSTYHSGTGGKGAYSAGNTILDSEEIIYIYVGGQGENSKSSSSGGLIAGGYNGGGSNGSRDLRTAGGGGATDVRLIDGNWDNFESLKSRIMVAGAGGASGISNTGAYGNMTEDKWSSLYGGNGTQTSGGKVGTGYSHNSGATAGGFGYAGNGGYYVTGGGGSGYYGGAGGQHITPSTSGGGGGGSSFISGHDGCDAIDETSTKSNIIHTGQPNHYSGYIFTNTEMIAGNAAMPTHDGTTTMDGNEGNGYAKITLINGISSKVVNKEEILNGATPVLKNGLIPVKLENDGTVKKADPASDWYNYKAKRWANAVILEDETQTYADGEVIPESNIESYFVWVPRYKYKIFNEGNYTTVSSFDTSKVQKIDVVFESKDTELSTGSTVGEYLTHPAFTAFNTNGFWVGKFETGYKDAESTSAAQVNSSDPNYIEIKPNVYSWRSLTLGNMFKASYEYNRTLESHMMKNLEWGAVAYLQHSKYGSAKSVRVNNNSAHITGYAATEEPTKGYSRKSSIAGNRIETTALNTDGTYTKRYNTTTGYLASTTGNITGVYDMSGGSYEYVMGYATSAATIGRLSEITSLYSDFFTNSDWDKYYDKYSSTSDMDFNKRILGDATGEMGPFAKVTDPDGGVREQASWYYDRAYFAQSNSSWFIRGGDWSTGVESGDFSFDAHSGVADLTISFRIVLAP